MADRQQLEQQLQQADMELKHAQSTMEGGAPDYLYAQRDKLRQQLANYVPTERDKSPQKTQEEIKREVILGDVRAGAAVGRELVPEGSLGRLGDREDIQSSISRLQDLSQGLTAKESEARRAEAFRGIDIAGATQSRALQAALARAGVRGGVAGKQLSDVALGTIQAKGDVERKLFLEDRAARESGLERLIQAQSGVAQFDIAQAAKERLAQLQTGLAFGGIGAAERGAELSVQAQQAAAAQSSGSGKK